MVADIFEIQKNSLVDGPGIRTTVFFKGCNLKCKWCHNPESQKKEPQMLIFKDKCTDCGICKKICESKENCTLCGKCVPLCVNNARKICGKLYNEDEVFKEIMSYDVFYEASGGGVTFSGGECMLQIDFLTGLLKRCKQNNIHTAIDTAGNVSWDKFEKVLPYTDLFLYDIKCITKELHILGTGVSNKLILDNLEKLSYLSKSDIIIRIPVVGGFNDTEEEFYKIKDFIKNLRIQKTELLKYHSMGEYKYRALSEEFEEFQSPSDDKMKLFENIITN